MHEFIPFVKWQASHHRKQLNRATDPRKKEILQGIVDKFDGLLAQIEALEGSDSPSPNRISSLDEIDGRVALRPKDIADLPDELMEQLSIKKNGDDVEIAIQEIIEAAGGAMSLDQIIIGYYRKTGEVLKRNLINAKLYRMGKKDLIYSLPGKKGVYCTFNPAELAANESKEEDLSFL